MQMYWAPIRNSLDEIASLVNKDFNVNAWFPWLALPTFTKGKSNKKVLPPFQNIRCSRFVK
jgi:hypothetical protein